MEFLIKEYKQRGNLFHAYLIEGQSDLVVPKLTSTLETIIGKPTGGNPDVWIEEFGTFDIDKSRQVQERHVKKPIEGAGKYFIFAVNSFTLEAANALLKTFEEGRGDTHFFLVVPSADIVIPTLRSRCLVIPHSRFSLDDQKVEPLSKDQGLATKFLKSSTAEKMKLIAPFTKKTEDQEVGDATSFVFELEKILSRETKKNPDYYRALENLQAIKKYLLSGNASVRLIFEHLALTMPQLKK